MTLESAARAFATSIAADSRHKMTWSKRHAASGRHAEAFTRRQESMSCALRATRLAEWTVERYGRPATPPACVVHFTKP